MKVVIIGSGLSGLVAAYTTMLSSSNQVIILEKNKKIGGNSTKASSGINFINRKEGDSEERFFADTMKAGKYKNNAHLVSLLIRHSDMAKKLLESLSLDFNKVFLGGGHSLPRTHSISGHPKGNIGNILVNTLFDKNKELGVPILTDYVVHDIHIHENRAVGVMTSSGYIPCDAVVLATGGYGNCKKLLGKYASLPTTNAVTTTGDGIYIGMKNNLLIKNLEDVQVHPTAFVDPENKSSNWKFLLPGAYRGLGSVLIEKNGNRFTNELGTRDKVSHDILNNTSHVPECPQVLLVADQKILDRYGDASKFYTKKKLFVKYNTVSDISKTYDINMKNLKNSLSNLAPPYYVAVVTPAVHYTMGGIVIDDKCRVYKNTLEMVSNLYACGEVTTGLHGGNRLIGNSLLECVVFGMIVGSVIK